MSTNNEKICFFSLRWIFVSGFLVLNFGFIPKLMFKLIQFIQRLFNFGMETFLVTGRVSAYFAENL